MRGKKEIFSYLRAITIGQPLVRENYGDYIMTEEFAKYVKSPRAIGAVNTDQSCITVNVITL